MKEQQPMTSEDQLYRAVWCAVLTSICILALTIAGCNSYERTVFKNGGYEEVIDAPQGSTAQKVWRKAFTK